MTSRLLALTAISFLLGSCSDGPTAGGGLGDLFGDLECSIPKDDFFDGGVGPDGIPALENPGLVGRGDPDISYLDNTPQFPDPRVVGFVVDGQPYAVPHNILWWHEIVNMDFDNGLQLAITYCPLTASAMVFDRAQADGAVLAVSGLLFKNNLIMRDRGANSALIPQMMRGGRCGTLDGVQLDMFPAIDLNWSQWASMHPNTLVTSGDLPFGRDYTRYPYGSYEQNRDLLFPQRVPGIAEERRRMKERILGIPSLNPGDYRGLAVPYGELRQASEDGIAAVRMNSPQGEVLVLWSTDAEGAMAFRPQTTDGTPVTLQTQGGAFVDEETRSEWSLDGRAVAGPMTGTSLEPVPDTYVAFWFAWEAFQPDTDIWTL